MLFTLIAERYERRSLGVTFNLVFSEWEKVFANPMATAAAIDRIVHHAIILEFDLPSYRTTEAQNRRSNAFVASGCPEEELCDAHLKYVPAAPTYVWYAKDR